MKVIGLTGNIGSGKSTVAEMFRQLGAKIIDADSIARKIVEPGQRAWKEIKDVFGDEVISSDQSIDRQKLGDIVFNDVSKRALLDNITHPKIFDEINNLVNEYEKDHSNVVIIEAALIIEKGGLLDLIDKLILVVVDEDTQTKRIKLRDDIPSDQIQSRIKSQMQISEKKKYADYIIDNNGSVLKTRTQANKIWKEINT
ncbi:MAG: dephospho-CoA kinase [Thermodesulfobacteriota bacterium]